MSKNSDYKPFWEIGEDFEVVKYYDFSISDNEIEQMKKVFIETQSLEQASKVMTERPDFPHEEVDAEQVKVATIREVSYWSRIMGKHYDDKGRFVKCIFDNWV